jgi:hypothetical protein
MRISNVAGPLAAAAVAGGLLAGCGSKTTTSPASTGTQAAASPTWMHSRRLSNGTGCRRSSVL